MSRTTDRCGSLSSVIALVRRLHIDLGRTAGALCPGH
ncbi:putative leader peptide [Pseudonocardia sp. ICBG1293]